MSTIVLLFTANDSLYNGGGTERVFVNMANEFTQRGYEIYAVVNDVDETMFFPSFHPQIHLVKLHLRNRQLPTAIKIKREINRIVPFCDNPKEVHIASLAADKLKFLLNGKDISCIICYEHEDVLIANRLHIPHVPTVAMLHNAIPLKLGTMDRWALKEENKVTVHQVLMPDFVQKAEKYVNTRVIYIPNVVNVIEPTYWKHVNAAAEHHSIITVGRLDPVQKQTHILIEAFHLLADTYPDWNVYIYGQKSKNRTSYITKLQHLIKRYNLQDRVFLCGVTKHVTSKLQLADIFAFPSAYEGFSLALTEAMSVGLPSVVYASADGVGDLLDDEKTGIVCNDGIIPFAKGLEELMKSPKLREKMGKKARESVKKYNPVMVWDQWEHLIQQLQKAI